jgi:hypothetical protein
MKDKYNWITQRIKYVANIKEVCMPSLRTASNDPRAKMHYIKYFKILRKVIKEATMQH